MRSSAMRRLDVRRQAAADPGGDGGFTLIELMVALLIMAILLAIAIPTFLGVTNGANDRGSQSNLNIALTTAKAAAVGNGQTYFGLTVATLTTDEPSLTWALGTHNSGAVTTQGPVSFYVSSDGNGIVITSFSRSTDTCWYAVDNMNAISDTNDNGPYVTDNSPGTTGSAPTTVGTYYGEATTTVATGCNAWSTVTWVGWGPTYGAIT